MPVPSRSPSLLCPLPSPVSPRVLLPCAPTPIPCTHHLRPLRPASSTQVRRSAVRWHRCPVPCPPAPLRAPLSARLSRSASTAQPYPPPLFCPVAALRWPPSHYTLPASRRCAGPSYSTASTPPPAPARPARLDVGACSPPRRQASPPARRRSSTPILLLPPASFRAAAACLLPRLPPTMLRAAVPPFSSFAAPSRGPRPTSSKLWRPRSSAHRAPPRRYFIPRSPPAVSTFPSAT
ncbi:hypothetical protein B0H14DRAFT_2749160, partial [Mycena olivaceomarginata]